MPSSPLQLVSHAICPFVQRAAIALHEKGIAFERIEIDISNKPEWFLALSPLGKTPVLIADGTAIFESSVILEYLEETQKRPLHPGPPLERARHRAWIEFSSAAISDIHNFYMSSNEEDLAAKRNAIVARLKPLEKELPDHVGKASALFAGASFSLVDAAYAPIFRMLKLFERFGPFEFLSQLPKTQAWADNLLERPSVKAAVSEEYENRLFAYVRQKGSALGLRIDKFLDYRR